MGDGRGSKGGILRNWKDRQLGYDLGVYFFFCFIACIDDNDMILVFIYVYDAHG